MLGAVGAPILQPNTESLSVRTTVPPRLMFRLRHGVEVIDDETVQVPSTGDDGCGVVTGVD